MNRIRDYVENLSYETLLDISESYDNFERDGFTGDTPIRIHAVNLMKDLGNDGSVVMQMEQLIKETYRALWLRKKI